ncbi:Replication protein A subunit [Nymphaea thermarum]|nr:Replication protein A subunit [Nymphaea thermarum]
MDISSPAAFVNAELLKMYTGRRVRTVVKVLQNDGGILTGQSPDGHQISIKGLTPSKLSQYVEVIGVAEGNQSIRAEICTNFGDTFALDNFNELCRLANSEYKSLFI